MPLGRHATTARQLYTLIISLEHLQAVTAPIGLFNPNNACFLNAIVQLTGFVPRLAGAVMELGYIDVRNKVHRTLAAAP
jgi:hypothetical protein